MLIIVQYNVLTTAKILIRTPPQKTQYIGIQRLVLDSIKHLKTGKNISDNQTW